MDDGALRAVELAAENYQYYPNVRGVSFGSKYSNGRRIENVQAVQFFVTEKIPEQDLVRTLPRFVYARHPDGTVDRAQQILTDVIELGRVELCCAAGDKLSNLSGEGCTTMIFRNKAAADNRLLMLTCSHVAGDLSISPQPDTLVGGQIACQFQARVIANTVQSAGRLEFDIALTEVFEHDPALAELTVTEANVVLDGFADEAALATASVLDCVSPMSGSRTITVESSAAEVRGINHTAGASIAIANLIACKGEAVKGDSGGIVFTGTKAAGIVVARGEHGWVLIHPIEAAVEHIATIASVDLRCFA